MSWRANTQRSGANDAPLAGVRRWGGGGGGGGPGGPPGPGGYDPYQQQQQHQQYGGYSDRGAPPSSYGPPGSSGPPPPSSYGQQQQQELAPPPGADAPRKRKSRWGDENDKVQVAGMPTAISGQLQGRDLENYANHVRLEEISRKLRSGEVVPPERERSPSPPPTYDHQGRRTNTREIRYRKKLEDERNRLVERAIRSDPNYKPPNEYIASKRQMGRPSEKIYIPVKEFPEIKWIGLILGPRGNSLKNMERDTGAKIVIRGKGSTKEGKQSFGTRSADEEDELHCNVTADSQDKVDACVKLINKVIATAASTPDEQNDHKRMQLRELAMLNGTLRDDENQPCQNCGKVGHRKYDCPEERNFTANVICRNCGGMGHMARDCIAHRQGRPGFAGSPGMGGPGGPGGMTQAFDSEYSALMAELGEGPGINPNVEKGAEGAANGGGPGGPGGERPVPPWRIPSNWHPPQPPQMRPQGRDGGYGGPPGFGGPRPGFNGPPGQYGQQQGYPPHGPPQQYGGYGGYQQPPPAQGGYGGYGSYDPAPPAAAAAPAGYDYSASYYGGAQQQQQPAGYGGYQGVAA